MNEEFDSDDIEKPAGLPGWMATFADMMALLMSFFVLLLSYSVMDVEKFKQIAGQMRNAFGVQNMVSVEDIPRGTDVITDQFSPAPPEPTPIETVEQSTQDSAEAFLQRQKALEEAQQQLEDVKLAQSAAFERSNEALMKLLAKALDSEIGQGILELEYSGQQIIFRVLDNGAFSSASAFLQPRFKPVILKITRLLNQIPGAINVAGHTDNQPISSELFSSNWDLSAQRAVAVASQMTRVEAFDSRRMTVSGLASNQPLMTGDSILARNRNRRVEIVVSQGEPLDVGKIDFDQQ